ncbi:MAG: sigma-70 family RNA polymerase sigma factor [Chitinophagaceae bacterium]|nr:sigma-70 family RNA polymerase sigma factor [Chitinophagaceae bacterium]MCB9045979.1 sigma-70 family RNA polymerase sigma factor [Chitinophagales bacterium]
MLHTLHPEQWVDNYADKLYAFAKARVSSEETARDIVQDTFLSAWKAREGFRGEASEKSWLYTICRNKITDHYRKAAHSLEELGMDDYGSDLFTDEGHWRKDRLPEEWQTTSARLETKEFYNVLDFCKNKLKELQKAVFVMKYIDDIDTDEICKILNITPSNYWVLVHRAKLQLRDCLDKSWFKK